jgi:release factor glutamine methyltransferase
MRELIKEVSRKLSTDLGDAEYVIASLLGRKRFELYIQGEICDRTRTDVLSCVEKMQRGMPAEYLTGRVQFRDHVLRISPGVFIPRAETEYLVEIIYNKMHNAPNRILEIGTGSGAISIALASLYPKAYTVATDVSTPALDNARQNIKDYALESRIALVRCSMYDGISGGFDLIVSNPPYIPRPRLQKLSRSVREFEPMLALDGGEQGVEFSQRLILEGQKYLPGGGVMALEIDEEAVELLKDFLDNHGISPFSFVKDLFGVYRYLFIEV